jgi:hypothetical protein
MQMPASDGGSVFSSRAVMTACRTGPLRNRYERRWFQHGGRDGPTIAQLIAATREADNLPASRSGADALRETCASVIAPMLVAFVEHVLADCAAHGITQLAFLARDGQLPYLIAERIIAARGLKIEARYVYGSRHALHIAGYASQETAASWLLEDTHQLSLADVARRGEIPLQLVEDVAREHGYLSCDENIPVSRRAGLQKVVRDPRMQAALAGAAERAWSAAYAYYRAAGFVPNAQIALVDVGWSGRMQGSLRSILDRAGFAPTRIRGHYLCLATRASHAVQDSLHGFLHDPAWAEEPCPFDSYRPVIESALAADHGTTLGFAWVDGVPTPTLGAPPDAASLRNIRVQQATVLRFVTHLLEIERARAVPVRWSRAAVRRHLRLLLEFPSETDARAFELRAHHDGQADTLPTTLAHCLAPGMQLFRRKALGSWPEATYRLSGFGALLALLRVVRIANTSAAPWLNRRRTRLLGALQHIL